MKRIKEYYKREFSKPCGKSGFFLRCTLYFVAISKIILHRHWEVIIYAFLVAIMISLYNKIISDYQAALNDKYVELKKSTQRIIALKRELILYKEKYGEIEGQDEN